MVKFHLQAVTIWWIWWIMIIGDDLTRPQLSLYHFIQRAARGEVGAKGEMGREKAREENLISLPIAHFSPCAVHQVV